MSQPSDLRHLLGTMQPALNEGVYVFASVPVETDISGIPTIGSFCEEEGLTLIVEEHIARREQLHVLFRAAWITLTVHSALKAVGLTAAFAAALSAANISCNVVAAAHHDHIFVPVEQAQKALRVLEQLQETAQSTDV